MQGGEYIRFPFEEETEELIDKEEEEEYYPREFDIDFTTGKLTGRIAEGARAVAVWAYLAIKIVRYKYIQYSWEYGNEMVNLIGGTYSDEYVKSEVNRMLTECLEVNPYVNGIENLEIEKVNETLHIKFTLLTDYGSEEVESEDMTFENIMDSMMEDMPDGLDTSEGSLIYHSCVKQAARLEEVYVELAALTDNQYADTADLDHLVKSGQERRTYIEEATAAEFEGVFNVPVPIGTEFSGDDYNYIVTDVINEEEHKYRLECEDPGTAANGWLGDLMCLDDIDGLEDAALTKLLIEGKDEEDEESYRMRIMDSFGIQAFGGNRAYYKERIGAIDGVGGVKPYRRKGTIIPIVIISDEYRKAESKLINDVQTHVDPIEQTGEGIGIAPIGHSVSITTVTEYIVNVSAVATYDTGYSAEGLKTKMR